MYAFDWIRQRAPMTVSFSTHTPRPTSLPSPTVTRSRIDARSPTTQPAPSVTPADTTAPLEIVTPSPSTSGASGSRFAVDERPSAGCLPMTTLAPTAGSAIDRHRPRTIDRDRRPADVEGGLERGQRLHHREALGAGRD